MGEAAELLISQLAIFTDADRIRGAARDVRAARSTSLAWVVGGGAAPALQGEEYSILDRGAVLCALLSLSYNCLKRAGVQTVGDLVRKSESELNAIPNFGQKSIDEAIETLHTRGLDLRQD